jgi:ketosteroid isomerase-like protein
MKKITLLIIIVSCILLVSCQPQQQEAETGMNPDEIVTATIAPTPTAELSFRGLVEDAMGGWDSEEVDAEQVDTTLSYFAEEAVFEMVGFSPEIPSRFEGKEQIRAAYESWLPLHPRLEVVVEEVDGNTVTATTSYWSDQVSALGVAPLVGRDVYVFEGDKIARETWTLEGESQQAFAAAMATVSAPTPTVLVWVPISAIEDVVGIWRIPLGGFEDHHIMIEFRTDGTYSGPAEGTFKLEGSQVHFLTVENENSMCALHPDASYDVKMFKQDGRPIKLFFSVAGEDECDLRREGMHGKTLTRSILDQ